MVGPQVDEASDEVGDPRHDGLREDLGVLASDVRLRILGLLVRPQTAESMTEALAITRQAVLKHLHRMEERGFVMSERVARNGTWANVYHVVPQKLFSMHVHLADVAGLEPHLGAAAASAVTSPVAGNGRVLEGVGVLSRRLSAARSFGLMIIGGPQAGERLRLSSKQEKWAIGRDEDCDVCIAVDPFASGRHCEVRRTATGHELVDNHSTNGTYLNYRRLPRGGRIGLALGDVIGAGRTAIVYQHGG